jgi:catechol-2,3-dioxygenase
VSFSPVRLNHAVLFVADLERSERFYTGVFGMEVIAREPRANAAFLRLPRSGNHHDLGLFGVGTTGSPKRHGSIGLYHLAWQLDTIDELAAARRALVDAGAYTGESSHGATKSIYGADPDGNEFELMWMLPRNQPLREHRPHRPPRPRRRGPALERRPHRRTPRAPHAGTVMTTFGSPVVGQLRS